MPKELKGTARRTVVMASFGIEKEVYPDMVKAELPELGWSMKELWKDVDHDAFKVDFGNPDHFRAVKRAFMEQHPEYLICCHALILVARLFVSFIFKQVHPPF